MTARLNYHSDLIVVSGPDDPRDHQAIRRLLVLNRRQVSAWCVAAGLIDGCAFRAIDRHGIIAGTITARRIGTIVSRAADRAGLRVHFTAHSLRSGLVAEG